jgi:hypothetical protein
MNRLGELFNEYHAALVAKTQPTDAVIDMVLTVRVRLFGRDEDKQAAWDEAWRHAHPDWGPVQWVTVSSDPPEIWGDLRMVAGRLTVNNLALGHELHHVVRLHDPRLLEIDTLPNI